ncbi:hypothetical protein [Sinomonas sp. ASV322]|uniref:hypothetical protein n=1 Tax=Sinomonas sp. ASV322 TaxID=3041920 RepID=UPI0027DC428F|nr:hypothetical protein [Sinomonas sp. ASV322]MDQ4504312.1 hypothetical protein [Sinomonas sp. ASV322]
MALAPISSPEPSLKGEAVKSPGMSWVGDRYIRAVAVLAIPCVFVMTTLSNAATHNLAARFGMSQSFAAWLVAMILFWGRVSWILPRDSWLLDLVAFYIQEFGPSAAAAN